MQHHVCEICGARPASRRCPLCGRYVCDEDWDSERGVCILCSSSLCQVCGRRLAIATCAVCGRLVCEECSVQVTPVVRLCRECYRKYGGRWPPRSRAENDVRRLAEAVSSLLLLVSRRPATS